MYTCMPKVSFLSLVSSDGALYNIDPTTVKVKRRIQLTNISRLSASLLSDNFFVVHVPLEYDYLFVSGRKTEIISALRQAFTEATSQELSITMQNMYVVMHNESQSRPTCGELSEMPKNITLYQIIENVNFLLPMKYIIIVKMWGGGGGAFVSLATLALSPSN